MLPNILYHYPAHLHTFSRYEHTQTAPSEPVILGVPPAIFTLPCYFNERRCDKSGQCFRFFSRRYLAARATTAPNLPTHPPLSRERGKDCRDLTIDTAEDRRKAVEVLEPSSTRRREKRRWSLRDVGGQGPISHFGLQFLWGWREPEPIRTLLLYVALRGRLDNRPTLLRDSKKHLTQHRLPSTRPPTLQKA